MFLKYNRNPRKMLVYYIVLHTTKVVMFMVEVVTFLTLRCLIMFLSYVVVTFCRVLSVCCSPALR